MVDAARARVPAATVLEADAQSADLLAIAPGAPFDRVVSRFGVMFFADPVAAFANIRATTSPGARLAFAAWREGEVDLFLLGLRSLMDKMANPPDPPLVGAPGPMGLADPHRVRQVLTDSGWTDLRIDVLDATCDYSVEGSDGIEERLATALSGTLGRAVRAELEQRLGPQGWSDALDDARVELRDGLVDGAVRFTGHTWLVTATNP